jgi:flagellar export protein FliJ
MSQFRFRLDSLLKLNRHREDAARQELAEAQRKVMEGEHKLEALAQAREAAASAVTEGDHGHALTALQSGYAHIHRIATLEASSRDELAALGEQHEARRQVAVEAQRARRTVEQLHDKHRDRHAREQQRAEDRQIDETGTQLAARKGAEHLAQRGDEQG